MGKIVFHKAGELAKWWATAPDPKKALYKKSINVDVHCRGFSIEQPLFTTNVANCLIVIVNKIDANSGTLAHVNITQSGMDKQDTAFGTVDEELAAMLKVLSAQPAKVEVLLWKGNGFDPGGNKALKVAYADGTIKQKGFAAVHDFMIRGSKANMYYAGVNSILFDPVTKDVYELNRAELELLGPNLPSPAVAIVKMKTR